LGGKNVAEGVVLEHFLIAPGEKVLRNSRHASAFVAGDYFGLARKCTVWQDCYAPLFTDTSVPDAFRCHILTVLLFLGY
jgi:hypothetical protein